MKWTTKPLADIADFRLGKMLDEAKNKGDSLPYLANINVRWGEFDLSNLREMRFEYDDVDRYGLRYGDIVMCEGGEPGRCAIWKDAVPGMMIQKALHRIRPHGCLDHRFLYYSFLHKGKNGGFTPLFTGATIKHLPREKLELVEITFPPLEVQRRIADTLSAYDDLIENNGRRIALLERAARLLYEEWFVRLRFPGHEHTNLRRTMPAGWSRAVLGDVLTLKRGYDLPAHMRQAGDVPIVSSSGITGFHDTARVRGPGLVTGRYGTLGAVYLIHENFWPLNTALYVSDFKGADIFFAFQLLKDLLQSQISNKAAVPGVNRNDLHRIPLLRPTRMLEVAFGAIVSPLYAQIRVLGRQVHCLSAARDLLLPRLMSGEVAV